MQDGGSRRGAAEDRGHVPAITRDAIGALKLSKLTPKAVGEFRDRQMDGRVAATVVKRLNLLALIIGHATRNWGLPFQGNPASATEVDRPEGADIKRDRRLLVPGPAELRAAAAAGDDPPPPEVEVLYAAMAGSTNKWDLLLTRWAVEQGTRQGEALAMRWKDVDLDRRILTVWGRHRRGTKNHERRKETGPEKRPLMPGAIAILKEVMPEGVVKREALVFPAGGVHAFRVRWQRVVRRAAEKLEGIPKDLGYLADLTYHDLRHEATSRLALVFTNSLDLMKVTGHLDTKSLARYYQPHLTDLAEVAARAMASQPEAAAAAVQAA